MKEVFDIIDTDQSGNLSMEEVLLYRGYRIVAKVNYSQAGKNCICHVAGIDTFLKKMLGKG